MRAADCVCLGLDCVDASIGDSAVLTAMLDRLLYHGHLLKCGPCSWRTKKDAAEH